MYFIHYMDIPIEQILQDFSIVMIISTAMALIFHRLKQPLVIGFIVAGALLHNSTYLAKTEPNNHL